jgi:hypothetical protein
MNSVCALILVSACSLRSDFEDFAYQGCIKEGKYPDKICACNAKNLDAMLTDDEKSTYKKAVLGNPGEALKLMATMGKLFDALQKCA